MTAKVTVTFKVGLVMFMDSEVTVNLEAVFGVVYEKKNGFEVLKAVIADQSMARNAMDA